MTLSIRQGYDACFDSLDTMRHLCFSGPSGVLRSLLWVVFYSLAVAACDTFTGTDPNIERMIQTEALEYELIPDWVGWETEISYTFKNRTGRRVFLENCNGSFAIHLEREQDGEWKRAWSPVRNACLSSPIVIESNETFADTLSVWGAPPDSLHIGPNFDAADPGGVYRIVWGTGLWSFKTDTQPLGSLIPIEWRRSNSFALRQ